MYEPEEIEVDSPNVACDGGGGPLGHPRVWLSLDAAGKALCPYCSRRFVYRAGAPAGSEIDAKTPDGVSQSDPSTTPPAAPQA
jgi:uncharacterized Zn-finger protein